MSSCKHEHHHQIGADSCYTGPVAVHPYTDENRAAHGGITYTAECDACGACRSVNQNGWHVEHGPWGPSRAERIRAAQQALATERSKRYPMPEPLELTNKATGRSVVVTCDPDGMLTISGFGYRAAEDQTEVIRALPPAWLDAACAVRRHVSRLASLESELTEARA